MNKTRWGIIGPGSIAHNFASGLSECASGDLLAIASRSADRRAAFGDRFGIADNKRFADYDAICADPDIDAIYIATPHPWHAELAIKALRAGKNVLCEKPAGLIAGEVVAISEVAAQEGRLFMEAYMYRCHPQIQRMLDIISSGEIGAVRHIVARFGFNAGFDADSRLYNRDLAGGGILDVGGYTVSFARLVAGEEPEVVTGVGHIGASGVDETAFATLKFPSGITAEISVAIAMNMDNVATVTGSKGSVHLPNPWVPGRDGGPSDTTIEVTIGDETRVETLKHPEHLFTFEAEAASVAIATGKMEAEHPAMTPADSIGNAIALDAWRRAVGYGLSIEAPSVKRIIPGVLPSGLPEIPKKTVGGLEMSSLVMGCDNQDSVAEGAIIWDAWWEAGGNAFDTAFIYGGGRHEEVLGQWMASRGVADQAAVIVKGGHTPYCTPRSLVSQLDISLDRLGLNKAPVYIMHRDNADVPVSDFMDVLNDLHKAGRIGAFGGSNWSQARFEEANAYADQNGLQRMTVLNNNLALAVMEKPVWPGCVSSNDASVLDYLKETQTAHFSWSAQARGYFLDKALRDRLPAETGPEACFGSKNNAERRQRAEKLAAERGVTANAIAASWVLSQSFPSFALIGPRSPGEIVSTMSALGVSLTASEVAWLNLETDAV